MKKFIAVLAIIIIYTNIIFVNASSSDITFVNEVLSHIKDKIEIPPNYTNFNNKLVYEENEPQVYISWYGDGDGIYEGGKIDVVIDSNYRIISFEQYFYGDYTGNYKLSKIDSNDAVEISNSFLKKLCPEFYESVKIESENTYINRNYNPYNIKYIRYENKIPCFENYIYTQVNPYNSKVALVKVKWDNFSKISSPDTKMSSDAAKVAMYDKIGLVKEYSTDDNNDLYVRYADLSDGRNYINAYTAEILDTGHYSDFANYKNALYSPKNFNPVFVMQNEDGTEIYSDDYGTYIYSETYDYDGNLKRTMTDIEKNDIRYYYYHKNAVNDNKHLSYEACKKIANRYCSNNLKSFIRECELLNYTNQKNSYGEEIYYFNYARIINGIDYDNNGAVIAVSSATGEVVDVVSGWDVFENPKNAVIISDDVAFQKYIENCDFGLQYVIYEKNGRSKELRLVYAPNPNKKIYIDALTGNLIDENSNLINYEKNTYQDIENNIYSNQIGILLNSGILDNDMYFFPNEDIKMTDFILWLARTVDCVQYRNFNELPADILEKCGITAEDIIINGNVTVEDGIKYIVKYLGYTELAILPDTYKTDFYDEKEILPENIGYAAIAKGLKLIEGNYFFPSQILKRDVTAKILYNLINN